MEQNRIVVFESRKIRRLWHNEEWYFSVADVCGALTDAPNDLTAGKYWNKLAQRLRKEGSEVVTFCHQLFRVSLSSVVLTKEDSRPSKGGIRSR